MYTDRSSYSYVYLGMINEDICIPRYIINVMMSVFLILPAFSTYPFYQSMHNSRNITVISRGNMIPLDRNNFFLL